MALLQVFTYFLFVFTLNVYWLTMSGRGSQYLLENTAEPRAKNHSQLFCYNLQHVCNN